MYIVKDMMGIARNNELKFQKLLKHHPFLRRRSTCRMSSSKASLMKDDVKVKMPNKTLMILIHSDGVVNWDGVLKFGGKLEGDHVTHF